MVAMDKSEAAKESLNLATSFLRDIDGGQLYLVHLNPDTPGKSGATEADPEQDPVLATAVAQVKQQGISYRCINSTGQAGPKICSLAEENNIDLLIIGSPEKRPSIARNLPDLDRLLGSSLSDYVRVYANCPVLLARTPD